MIQTKKIQIVEATLVLDVLLLRVFYLYGSHCCDGILVMLPVLVQDSLQCHLCIGSGKVFLHVTIVAQIDLIH